MSDLPPMVLDADAEFTGPVLLIGSGTLNGSINGPVTTTERLWIGPEARIVGGVSARDIVVEGEVTGQLRASGRVELRQTARVEGDVRAASLALAEGAVLLGGCSTDSGQPVESEPAFEMGD